MSRASSRSALPPLPDWSALGSEAWAITTARRILEIAPSVEAARSSGEVLALRVALWRAGVPFLHREKTLELVRFARAFEWPLAVRAVPARAIDAVRPLDEASRSRARASNAWSSPFVPRGAGGGFEVVVLSGLPAAGKDWFARERHPDRPVVSLDDLRDELRLPAGASDDRLEQAASARVAAFLRERRPFVWNSTLLRERERRALVTRFRACGARVRLVSIEVSAELQRRRNRQRAAKVPASSMERMLARWEPVLPGESDEEVFFEEGVERSFDPE